jgi:hypothetical protein
VTDQKAEIQRMQKLLDEAVKKKEDYQKKPDPINSSIKLWTLGL